MSSQKSSKKDGRNLLKNKNLSLMVGVALRKSFCFQIVPRVESG